MFDNASSNVILKKAPSIRYSQRSSNSTENSDLDYNLYCFSQGYENKEKGFWRGVLRNKFIDFDLRFNKEWNRKIELEDDLSITDTQSQISSLDTDIISFVKESEIGWNKNLFQTFKNQQTGKQKQKNKEWLLSNGIKRAQGGVELRTQNYKQFEEKERNKKMKKEMEKVPTPDINKYQLTGKSKQYDLRDYNSIKKGYTSSDIKKTESSVYTKTVPIDSYHYGNQGKRIDANYKKEIKKGNEVYVESFKLEERANNLGRLEVSSERKKKERTERKPEPRNHERVYSSKKKRKISLDKYGKPISNTARLNVNTERKKEPKERLNNISRLEVSEERKKKERIERKPGSRKHERVYSSKKKRKVSLDKYGKPITNTSKLNVDVSTKKEPKERLENRSRLEVSVERKKKETMGRKPGSRKHSRIHSSKKKKLSVDSEGNPLSNTRRINVDTSKKKVPKERLNNISRLEINEEKMKKERIEIKKGSRKHERLNSSKKKKISVDKEGKPLTNVRRLRVGIEKGQVKYAQIEDFDKYEDKEHKRYQVFIDNSNTYNHNKPKTEYTIMKTPTKIQEYKKPEVDHQRQYTLTSQLPIKKSTEASKAFFTNKYQRIKKEEISKTSQTDYKKYQQTQIDKKVSDGDYSFSNLRYSSQNTSKLNTNDTNASHKYNRIDKGFDISATKLFGKKEQSGTKVNRNYSYNKDLITKKNNLEIKEKEKKIREKIKEKGLSENKQLDFSKYYKSYKTEKKQKNETMNQKPVDKINGQEIFEYNPKSSQSNKYEKSYKTTEKSKKQNEYSIDLSKYSGIFNKLNNKIQSTEISEETRSSDNKRNRSSAPYTRFNFSPGTMAYFKLQFLTTKQVCEKFWESIDNGELSITMFDPQRSSLSSKLSNYLSPEKNRHYKIRNSIENSDNTSKFRYSGNINKKMNFINDEVNIGRTRRSYKA